MSDPHDLPATANAVERTISALGIDLGMQTDPELLADILRADMRLHDLAGFTVRLGEKLTHPQPLRPFFDEISAGINHRQPVLKSFLGEALDAGLIRAPDERGGRAITRLIHHTYLLSELTKAMVEDVGFTRAVGEHLISKREEIGIRRTFLGSIIDMRRLTRDVFAPAKAKTMDFVFLSLYFRLRRATPGPITGARLHEKNFWLILNIVEAVLTDRKRGERNNALAGVALIANPIRWMRILPGGRFIENHLPPDWPALYHSWNMAFVVGNLINPHILLPKLLMPCLLNAEPERYLFIRGVSLWVTIQFQLFARKAGSSSRLPDHEAIATRWGEVNRRHARRFMDEPGAPVV